MILLTLVLPFRGNQICLGKTSERNMGPGLWNGFGGHVEPGEDVVLAAVRELREESSLMCEVENLVEHGVLEFHLVDGTELKMWVYSVRDFDGEPVETEEMKPRWFDLDKIPYDEMWADDKYWMPLVLTNKGFVGSFWFDENRKIIKHNLVELR